MGILTNEILKSVMPKVKGDSWVDNLNKAMDRFGINTPLRAAAFLAQIAHESNELNSLTENLNYSADRLMKVWPKRFPTMDVANVYAKNPEKLANYIYADRMGNGNEASGEGWKFRGRGLIQLTGKTNYSSASKLVDFDFISNPDVVAQPEYAALTSASFWKSNGLNELADSPDQENAFVAITKKINGGTVGLDERKQYWHKAKSALGIG